MTDEKRWLQGKLALVTGSSQGTGMQIATELARHGARVAVHYRQARQQAEAVVETIRRQQGDAAAFQADLARSEDIRRLVAEVVARMGPVSIVVNNAGPFSDTPFRTLPEAEWDYILHTNLKAVYVLTQLVVDGMEAQGWGRIINLGATSAFVRSHASYGLAKAALLHLTASLAVELAPTVTVNAVVPSQIASPRTDRMPTYKAHVIATTPLGRLVTEAEIAHMVLLLCTPAFDFVTGQAIVMDGGRTIPVFPKLHRAANADS